MAIHCIGCLDRLDDEDAACARCAAEIGQAPDQVVASGLRRAVEIVATVIGGDQMDRRGANLELERVKTEDFEVWRELVATNIAGVLASSMGRRRIDGPKADSRTKAR